MDTPNALNKLNFVDAIRPRSMPAIQQRRNKLSNQLWQQIQLAKSQMEHTHFVIKRRVTIKDLEGNYKSIERPKRIELIPGKNSISVKNMNDLIEALELLKSETEAGSLDRVIENASGALKLNFNKK